MKCPKCGNELKRSKKNPDYMLCYECKKKYLMPEDNEDDFEEDYIPGKYTSTRSQQEKPHNTTNYASTESRFKVPRIIMGIISIVLFLLIGLQSCAMGAVNTINETGEIGGTGGFILALFMLIAGIITLAMKNSSKKSAFIVPSVFYILGSAMGGITSGSFGDLQIWAILSALFGCLLLLFMFLVSEQNKFVSFFVPIVIFLVLIAISNLGASMATDTGSKSSTATDKAKTDDTEVKEDDGVIDYTSDGKYSIKYTKHEIVKDYDGNDCLAVYFDFTNLSDEGIEYWTTVDITAFQNGKELETSSPSDDIEEYTNTGTEIKKDVTISCCSVFLLADKSEVELEQSDLISLGDATDTQKITLE